MTREYYIASAYGNGEWIWIEGGYNLNKVKRAAYETHLLSNLQRMVRVRRDSDNEIVYSRTPHDVNESM